jgi:hypothetical protein
MTKKNRDEREGEAMMRKKTGEVKEGDGGEKMGERTGSRLLHLAEAMS